MSAPKITFTAKSNTPASGVEPLSERVSLRPAEKSGKGPTCSGDALVEPFEEAQGPASSAKISKAGEGASCLGVASGALEMGEGLGAIGRANPLFARLLRDRIVCIDGLDDLDGVLAVCEIEDGHDGQQVVVNAAVSIRGGGCGEIDFGSVSVEHLKLEGCRDFRIKNISCMYDVMANGCENITVSMLGSEHSSIGIFNSRGVALNIEFVSSTPETDLKIIDSSDITILGVNDFDFFEIEKSSNVSIGDIFCVGGFVSKFNPKSITQSVDHFVGEKIYPPSITALLRGAVPAELRLLLVAGDTLEQIAAEALEATNRYPELVLEIGKEVEFCIDTIIAKIASNSKNIGEMHSEILKIIESCPNITKEVAMTACRHGYPEFVRSWFEEKINIAGVSRKRNESIFDSFDMVESVSYPGPKHKPVSGWEPTIYGDVTFHGFDDGQILSDVKIEGKLLLRDSHSFRLTGKVSATDGLRILRCSNGSVGIGSVANVVVEKSEDIVLNDSRDSTLAKGGWMHDGGLKIIESDSVSVRAYTGFDSLLVENSANVSFGDAGKLDGVVARISFGA